MWESNTRFHPISTALPPTSATEGDREVSEDVHRVLSHTNLPIDPVAYEHFIRVWRYNSFGKKDSQGLTG